MSHLPELQWLLLIAGIIMLAQCGCATEPITLEEGAAAQPAAEERALAQSDVIMIEQCPTFTKVERARRW